MLISYPFKIGFREASAFGFAETSESPAAGSGDQRPAERTSTRREGVPAREVARTASSLNRLQ
jgi:hypothetical protein